jgi:UDPglucose 6-dehydrogenase
MGADAVIGVDIDPGKVAKLAAGDVPFYEPGLRKMLQDNLAAGRLRFTTDYDEAAEFADVHFLGVGTPQKKGEYGADLVHVNAVIESLAPRLRRPAVIVGKSTVPVGTAALVRDTIAGITSTPFHVCSNPEFLKQGGAVEDFMKPDRVIVGVDGDESRSVMSELYAPFIRRGGDRILFMDIESAEVTKYAANAMLATRISFMNQMAMFCEAVGADVSQVRLGIGSDRRIGPDFLYPGPGYGGSCFPKDVKATVRTAECAGVSLDLLRAVELVNDRQKLVLLDKVRRRLGHDLTGRKVGVWGLAFKAETDDMRESPAIPLIDGLLAGGARVSVHDPKAMDTARRLFGGRVTYAADPYAAAEQA